MRARDRFPFRDSRSARRVDRTRRIASTAEGKLTGGSNRTPCGGDSGGSGGGDA